MKARLWHMARTAVVIACLAAAAVAIPSAAAARSQFDIRVLAHVPAPGYPALTLVAPDRTIYVGTFYGASGGDNGPSKVFAYSPDGTLLRSYTITGQTPGASHGIQVAAIDAHGLLYLLDQAPARVLTLDPSTGVQRTYATFADVPTCTAAPGARDCSDTVQDNPPEPDYGAFAPDGSLYVTDYQQGLLWRVPAGGGAAHVWFTDPQIDGAVFGPAGIILMPDHRTLMFDTSSGGLTTPGNPTTGKLYTIPIDPNGAPGPLTRRWESGPREAPDGFALAQSGNVYVALVGPGANQLVEVSPSGQELARAPASALANQQMQVPFDEPSSVQFDGQRLIVTNDPYFSGDASHMVLFDVWAGEPGQPIYVPPAAVTPAQGTAPAGTHYSLAVTPRRVRARSTRRLRFHAVVRVNASERPLSSGLISFAGRRVHTDARGNATLVVRIGRPGRYRARLASATGAQLTTAYVRAVRSPRRRSPAFTG